MSKQTYAAGFCKAAAAYNVDPRELAKFALSKKAEGEPGLWQQVLASIEDAKNAAKGGLADAKKWWDGQDQSTKAILGALGGSALGTGLGAAVKGTKGLRAGAILGALGGGAAAVDWKALSSQLDTLAKERAKVRADLEKGKASAAAALSKLKPGEGEASRLPAPQST